MVAAGASAAVGRRICAAGPGAGLRALAGAARRTANQGAGATNRERPALKGSLEERIIVTRSNRLSASYDRVAADYTANIADELAGKPLDRALLQAFAEQVGTLAPVADLGCGPGHVAAFLAGCG